MRAVIQRVFSASVEVDGKVISSIGEGLLVFAGFYSEDSENDTDYIINKILGLRIFNDDNDVMNLSVTDIEGDILLVSQFTLYGDVRKGKRPSYSSAMHPDKASDFYDQLVHKCRSEYDRVKSGIFGANMKISLINNGPVTILLDSSKIL